SRPRPACAPRRSWPGRPAPGRGSRARAGARRAAAAARAAPPNRAPAAGAGACSGCRPARAASASPVRRSAPRARPRARRPRPRATRARGRTRPRGSRSPSPWVSPLVEVVGQLLEERLLAAALVVDALELAQQLLLLLGQVLGRLHEHAHELVAARARVELRQALAAQAEHLAALRALGDGHLGAPAQRRDLARVAERELREGARHLGHQVGAAALEDLVLVLLDHDVQVAAWGARLAGVALAADADRHALLDPGRDLDREVGLALQEPRAAAAA